MPKTSDRDRTYRAMAKQNASADRFAPKRPKQAVRR
jgi:hypothetical protein